MKSLQEITVAIQQINIQRNVLTDDGTFPNNPILPLLFYKQALITTDSEEIKALLESNAWVNSWKDGVYDYHHYHSTAHEVLCAVEGTARLQFGGPSGPFISVEPGDVVIIPAGVAHICVEQDENFKVIGAYPEGQDYDIMKGKPEERPEADARIKSVSLPLADPIYGTDGPLLKDWKPS